MPDNKFNSYDFFKENYFFEIDRKNQLARVLNIPFGLLVILGSSLLFIVKNISIPFIWFEVSPIIIGSIVMLFTIYFLIKSYYNYTYGFVASSEKLKNYYSELVKFNPKNADNDFLEFVTSEYSKYADINALNNDKKSSYLHKANGSLIVLLVFVIFSWLPYTWKVINKAPSIQNINIINIINITNINKINDILQKKKDGIIKLEELVISNTKTIKRLSFMIENIKNEEEKPVESPQPPPGRLIREGSE